jgi:hypothetical protein
MDKPSSQNFSVQDLGAQERAVLERLLANPFIGQRELATIRGLARSTSPRTSFN